MDPYLFWALVVLAMAATFVGLDVVEHRKAARGPVDADEAYDQLPTWISPKDDR